jgi:hypothetical protein
MSASNPSDGTTDRRETVDVIRRNWRAEVETAQVYRDLFELQTKSRAKSKVELPAG